jgi:sec-independent protein translocase protein TatA
MGLDASLTRAAHRAGATLCLVFSSFGPTELIIVLVIVLLIFGPKRLPGLGKSLGSGMREFKDSITGKDSDRDDEDDSSRPALEEPGAPDHAEPARAAERERTPQS